MGKQRRRPGNATRRAWAKPYSLKSGITGPNRTILAEYKARAASPEQGRDGFDSFLKSMRHRMGEQAFERHLLINPVAADRYVRHLCQMVGDWDADKFIVLSDNIDGRHCLYWNGPRSWVVKINTLGIYKSVSYNSVETAKWYYNQGGITWKEFRKHDDMLSEVQGPRYPEPPA